jgi:nucleotide-binding universal stress UspA family protein
MLPLDSILCPLDFSEPSYKALKVAIEMASHFQTEILLLHVVPSFSGIPADPGYAFAGQEEYEKSAMEGVEKELAIATQRIPAEIKSRTAIGIGDAADEIVRLANTEAADLIVIATHGLTGWRHLIFGSVAEKVIRLSECPVLVIPAHEFKKSA